MDLRALSRSPLATSTAPSICFGEMDTDPWKARTRSRTTSFGLSRHKAFLSWMTCRIFVPPTALSSGMYERSRGKDNPDSP
jgi:hypothetical protein